MPARVKPGSRAGGTHDTTLNGLTVDAHPYVVSLPYREGDLRTVDLDKTVLRVRVGAIARSSYSVMANCGCVEVDR